MKEILIITSGLVGSILTVVVQAIINAYINGVKHKREMQILVFQRKTEIVEKAISWYQEAIDNYLMLQLALRSYDKECNFMVMERIHTLSLKSMSLYNESGSRLNSIFLYYDFNDIYDKYKGIESLELINRCIGLIATIDYTVFSSKPLEYTALVCEGLNKLKIDSLNMLADLLNNQIGILIEIQKRLREEYNNYLK